MIIANERDVTAAVLAEAARAPDARTREILQAGITHLHAFVREARLTENEFRQLVMCIARLGQMTDASHNEVMVAAGSLGVSALVCLLNNDAEGSGTTANLMGPFWRAGAPHTPSGGSIVRSPTPGDPVFVKAWVHDRSGRPVQGAEVDVWHASPEGFYENQDPAQADMNLRGRFITDANGFFEFRTVKPAGYPVPVHGPVGDLLRAQGRHNMRPAHLHFLIHKAGYKTQFSQVYSADDPNLETDSQFGVTRALIAHYERHDGSADAPAGDVTGPWYSLERRFVIDAGDAQLPRPPISGRNAGPRPELTVLPRRS
ncbi:MAG TPA: dioxygenase [Burkholderiaceae bacterium]|nr:dioxygenase [Burkholderiaceae bacterium]